MPHSQSVYARIRDHIAALILENDHREGDAVPSVRSLAAELMANPLTVGKAYQPFLELGVVRAKRGVGMFIAKDGVRRLRDVERETFLNEIWPNIAKQIKRLHVDPAELLTINDREARGERPL